MSDRRKDIVDQAFRKFDKTGDGVVTIADMKGLEENFVFVTAASQPDPLCGLDVIHNCYSLGLLETGSFHSNWFWHRHEISCGQLRCPWCLFDFKLLWSQSKGCHSIINGCCDVYGYIQCLLNCSKLLVHGVQPAVKQFKGWEVVHNILLVVATHAGRVRMKLCWQSGQTRFCPGAAGDLLFESVFETLGFVYMEGLSVIPWCWVDYWPCQDGSTICSPEGATEHPWRPTYQ